MKFQFEQCKKRGKIVKIDIDKELVKKELREATYDLKSAEKSIMEGNYKWAIV